MHEQYRQDCYAVGQMMNEERDGKKKGGNRGLCVRFAGCCPQTGHITLSSTSYRQLENQAPNTTGSNHLYNTLELLMMGIMVPETC